METDEFARIVENALEEIGPPATGAEREGLITFLTEDIVPDFIASTLWEEIQAATEVYAAKPVREQIRHEDVEFEIDGQADFVLRMPDSSWTVTDLTVVLADLDAATRCRYQVQTKLYGELLRREGDYPASIPLTIEIIGGDNDREPVGHSGVGRIS